MNNSNTITFGNGSVADANRWASELKEYILDATNEVVVEQQRDNPNSQDLGTILSLVLGTPAVVVQELLEEQYPKAEKVILVMDNLHTYTTRSLYETFVSEVAELLCRRLEIHYTPKHWSWLNTAETEHSGSSMFRSTFGEP